ncbi:unnamed protein product [Lathyrus oleraceus]|uniref:Epidermal patterning factor-like protein n=1 Tax=Pisum sativum TaxID=3888 RepID=A0A9D4VJM1_PEA|nr:hypothetical protein KIW84_071494 [Pisum sativum]
MASLYSHTLFILLLLHHFLHPASSSIHQPRELLYEEKNKLGSIPPSCHSKCNECHPCMAVQVPSLPNHDSLPPHLTKPSSMKKWLSPSLQGTNNRYSNYKPLGWKCHCGDHFFNP